MLPVPSQTRLYRLGGILAISVLILAVHGYHYGIEDESIYLPAVKQHLNGALYPFDSAFFQAQGRLTVFPWFMALLARVTHLPVAWTFFAAYCLSTVALVLALRRIAERFFPGERSRWAAVLLPAALLTIPVAGTCLFLMDQHLHPRNLATICLLFAFAAALDRRIVSAGALTAVAAAFHPLMALYGASLLSMILWRTVRLHFLALGVSLAVAWRLLPPPSPAWQSAVQDYYFLPNWAWYEWVGIFAPLAGLAGCAAWASSRKLPVLARAVQRISLFGWFYFAAAVAVTFVPRFAQLAPLQPMRCLQLIYLFLFLVAAGLAAAAFPRLWKPAGVLFLALCGGMSYAQEQEFPASPHIEWPGKTPANDWLRAFDWIRRNTPVRAYFVMDPRYLERPGQDFHGFRGLAERSMLADLIEDRAVASVRPQVAGVWRSQSEALRNWSAMDLAALRDLKRRFGVDWALLERVVPPAATSLVCPYENAQLRVCRLD